MLTPPSAGPVWITGASTGIGADVARRFVALGYTVAGTARSADGLTQLAASLGDKFRPYPADVTDLEAIRALVPRVEADLGPIAIAVLNAGTYAGDRFPDLDPLLFRRTIEVNLMGTVHCLASLTPGMAARKAGHIVLVASVAGYRGLPRASSYGASKAALINLAESLRIDMDNYNVKVQVVNPGFIDTPLTAKNDFKMPFLMKSDKAAVSMVRQMGENRFEITFPKEFTAIMKWLRGLPYPLYFAAIKRQTGL